MAHLSRSTVAASRARSVGSIARLSRRAPAPRAMAARSAHVVRASAWQSTDVTSVNTMVEQGFVFVDLRADWEAEKYGRLDFWVNVPLAFMTEEGPKKNPLFLTMMQERFPDPNTPLIIACDDGDLRSLIAARELCEKSNYTQVYVLSGGTDDYLEYIGQAPPAASAYAAINDTISISYSTGWQDCFIHFNVDDKGWTEAPGWKMQDAGGVKRIQVEGYRMEFCINNGGDEWDAPPGNYNISEPGNYVITNGVAQKQ